MKDENIRIVEISIELNRLANSSVLADRTAVACSQAASLLERIREVLVGTWISARTPLSDHEAVKQLNAILAEQGEG